MIVNTNCTDPMWIEERILKYNDEGELWIFLTPAALASIILSSPLEEKAAEEDAEPLFGSCTRLVVGSNQAE